MFHCKLLELILSLWRVTFSRLLLLGASFPSVTPAMLRVCGTDTQPSAARYEVLEFFICWTGLMGGKRGVQLQDSAPETIRH